MVIKLYCDVCGVEIQEAAEGEGWDAGSAIISYGLWQQPKAQKIDFLSDALCKPCYVKIKTAIANTIKTIKETTP